MKLSAVGVTHKEQYGSTEAKPSPEKETMHPTIDVSGKLAEQMGWSDLKAGTEVEQMVRVKITRHSKTVENGKTRYQITAEIVGAGKCEECGKEDDDEGENEEEPSSAGLSVIERMAAG